jgi:hypothetical protein
MSERLGLRTYGEDAYGIITKQETAYRCYRSEKDSLNATFSAANADGTMQSQNSVYPWCSVGASYNVPKPMFVVKAQPKRCQKDEECLFETSRSY